MFKSLLRLPLLRLTLLAALLLGSAATLITAPTGTVHADGACAALTAEVYVTEECNAEIAANPVPNVIALEPNARALREYTFMRIRDSEDETRAIPIHDAPDGEVIGTLDAGFNFVTIRSIEGEWIEINADEWVHQRYLTYQYASQFAGVQVVDGANWARNFGWMAIHSYTAEYPGGPQVIDRARLHHKHDLINVYATVNVDGHNWYLIAPGEWVYHTWVALAHRVPRPEGVSGHWVAVDLYEQTLVAYEDDVPVFATLISSGLPGWETNTGIYTVWARLLSDHMRGGEVGSDFYSLENVPYTMYFDHDISLHGTYWHGDFGYRHSHGCVNLSITDARYLYEWTDSEQFREFQVYVYYSEQY